MEAGNKAPAAETTKICRLSGEKRWLKGKIDCLCIDAWYTLSKFSAKNRQADAEAKKADDEIDLDEALKMSVGGSDSQSSGSVKNSTRQNRIYQQIKRDIEIRERNKPTEECADQVYFVDKQRNAAVVIGAEDLKAAVKDKKKRDRSAPQITNLIE